MQCIKSVLAYIPVVISLTCSPALLAQDLVVMQGQEIIIGEAEQEMNLHQLKLEDGAKVRFAPNVQRWQVRAANAWIGSDIQIEASGRNGENGASTPSGKRGSASACRKGRNGQQGENGADGQHGVDITLNLGLVHFGSMSVHANGGAGGTGGNGGQGARGGAEDDCHAGSGGDGGKGGRGGDGGAGGEIRILYWSADRKTYIPVSNYGPGIHIENQGGKPGMGGTPGAGGKGGKGGWSKRGSGKLVARDSGEAGADGAPGLPGNAGQAGKFLIQPMAAPGSAQ